MDALNYCVLSARHGARVLRQIKPRSPFACACRSLTWRRAPEASDPPVLVRSPRFAAAGRRFPRSDVLRNRIEAISELIASVRIWPRRDALEAGEPRRARIDLCQG